MPWSGPAKAESDAAGQAKATVSEAEARAAALTSETEQSATALRKDTEEYAAKIRHEAEVYANRLRRDAEAHAATLISAGRRDGERAAAEAQTAADKLRTAAAVDGEQYRTTARQEANRLVETARTEANRLTTVARAEVDTLTARRDAVTRELAEMTASMNVLGASIPQDLLDLTEATADPPAARPRQHGLGACGPSRRPSPPPPQSRRPNQRTGRFRRAAGRHCGGPPEPEIIVTYFLTPPTKTHVRPATKSRTAALNARGSSIADR
ncbi:hypothetical protein [Fodinicola feengrottensis]|uniref:hypothetical protein n=1 Tax=Fodinicola feengrottensis TaxID=435914 RepID=UPI0013D5B239|nr:hypothetical protein [Fodinicola feengrottensis]